MGETPLEALHASAAGLQGKRHIRTLRGGSLRQESRFSTFCLYATLTLGEICVAAFWVLLTFGFHRYDWPSFITPSMGVPVFAVLSVAGWFLGRETGAVTQGAGGRIRLQAALILLVAVSALSVGWVSSALSFGWIHFMEFGHVGSTARLTLLSGFFRLVSFLMPLLGAHLRQMQNADAGQPNRAEDSLSLPPTSEERVERFLDRVESRLVTFPADVRDEVRRELRGHIENLVAAHSALGEDQAAATSAALHQFGDPAQIAHRFRRAWEATGTDSFSAAMRQSLGTLGRAFGALSVYAVLSFTLMVWSVTHYLWIHHQVWGDVLRNTVTVALWGLFALAGGLPLFCGLQIGRRARARSIHGAVCVLAALSSVFYLIGAFIFAVLPTSGQNVTYLSGLLLNAGDCLLIWLPLTTLAASLTLLWRKRQGKFAAAARRRLRS